MKQLNFRIKAISNTSTYPYAVQWRIGNRWWNFWNNVSTFRTFDEARNDIRERVNANWMPVEEGAVVFEYTPEDKTMDVLAGNVK